MVPEFPLAQVVVLTTAAVFMAQRITVSIYLDRFGVQPEEVGWNLQITLVRTVPVMLIGGLAAVVSWALFWLVWTGLRGGLPTHRSRFVIPFWIFLAAYALVFPVLLAAPAGRSVASGEQAPLGLVTGFPDECVRVVTDPDAEASRAAGQEWILLGESGGRVVLWNIAEQQTYRIRSATIDIVRLPRSDCDAA